MKCEGCGEYTSEVQVPGVGWMHWRCEVNRLLGVLDEERTRGLWDCGCGHVNGANLSRCAVCERRPLEVIEVGAGADAKPAESRDVSALYGQRLACYQGGALVTKKAQPYTTRLNDENARFYGGHHFVCESLTRLAAEIISQALGLELVEGPFPIEEDDNDA